ncbi:MAG: hypothetical protein HC767_14155 [Akkermansiaceae bacterium]|nr:hypothetical protein [Akkermansiaceae bacterium]
MLRDLKSLAQTGTGAFVIQPLPGDVYLKKHNRTPAIAVFVIPTVLVVLALLFVLLMNNRTLTMMSRDLSQPVDTDPASATSAHKRPEGSEASEPPIGAPKGVDCPSFSLLEWGLARPVRRE